MTTPLNPEQQAQEIGEGFRTNTKSEDFKYSLDFVVELLKDRERLDWLQSIMTPGDKYCEIYLAGLRWMQYNNLVPGDTGRMSDAQHFQIEFNPSRHPNAYGDTLRLAIDAARKKEGG